MHSTGIAFKPPHELGSIFIEATIGCSHNRCKFCRMYSELPVKFAPSPLADVEADLREFARRYRDTGMEPPQRRLVLMGGNPFALSAERLLRIAGLVHEILPKVTSIGCCARVTDIAPKTDAELSALADAGYERLWIGAETGDDAALEHMDKGFRAADTVEQCLRLDAAGIPYNFFCMTGLSGAGNGGRAAAATAHMLNRLSPVYVTCDMVTVLRRTRLEREVERGIWTPEDELDKYRELRCLVEQIDIEVDFSAQGMFNPIQIGGELPEDREDMLERIDWVLSTFSEQELRDYRAGRVADWH